MPRLDLLSVVEVLTAENPTLSASERSKVLTTLVPSGSSPILLNLLQVLSENGRLSSASKVFTDFNALMSAYRGELEVVVTSAEPLDNAAMKRLDTALKATQAAQGKKLKISNRVNPSVLGGLLVDFGDKTSKSRFAWAGLHSCLRTRSDMMFPSLPMDDFFQAACCRRTHPLTTSRPVCFVQSHPLQRCSCP